MKLPDYYAILGVARDAGVETIRCAWRAACFRYHPDSAGDAADVACLQEAKEAFRILSDPELRSRYDRLLRRFEDARARRAVPREPPILSAENIRSNVEFLTTNLRRLARVLRDRFLGP